MINSQLVYVWYITDSIVSPIYCPVLYDGIMIDTKSSILQTTYSNDLLIFSIVSKEFIRFICLKRFILPNIPLKQYAKLKSHL